MFQLGLKSVRNLKGVHPDLIRVATLGIAYSEYDFAVTEGLRGLDRQKELLAKGFSHTLQSKHLVQYDGYGHAFDVMAVGDLDKDGDVDAQDKAKTWDSTIYKGIAEAMQRAASELGVQIRWGGVFKDFFDGPHFELLF